MAAFNLPQENITADYKIGEKKLSVQEYGNGNVVKIEVEDSVYKCVRLDVKHYLSIFVITLNKSNNL